MEVRVELTVGTRSARVAEDPIRMVRTPEEFGVDDVAVVSAQSGLAKPTCPDIIELLMPAEAGRH
jgi:hypothetical protein